MKYDALKAIWPHFLFDKTNRALFFERFSARDYLRMKRDASECLLCTNYKAFTPCCLNCPHFRKFENQAKSWPSQKRVDCALFRTWFRGFSSNQLNQKTLLSHIILILSLWTTLLNRNPHTILQLCAVFFTVAIQKRKVQRERKKEDKTDNKEI